jgi:hypothetical protein
MGYRKTSPSFMTGILGANRAHPVLGFVALREIGQSC